MKDRQVTDSNITTANSSLTYILFFNYYFMENLKTCESCGKKYEYYLEPAEVKEGGTHICPECWEIEE